MIFVKSVKQMLRTPVTTALFALLFAASAFFVCSGIAIWARNQAAIKAFGDVFVTIGTVRQLPDSIEVTESWDAFEKDYTLYSAPGYSAQIPPSVLSFDGAGYVQSPRQRPFYGAWASDIVLLTQYPEGMPYNRREALWERHVVELTPLEDCLPDEPVEVRIENVLTDGTADVHPSFLLRKGDVILLCDHYNDDPQPLYAGRKYVAYIRYRYGHNPGLSEGQQPEWNPGEVGSPIVVAAQYGPDGALAAPAVTIPAIMEITDGFYESANGLYWLAFAGSVYDSYRTLPVIPTDATHLLLPFYSYNSFVMLGEDISPEEYARGDRVCLVPEHLAEMNGFSPGDKIRLPLYFADYKNETSKAFFEVDHTGEAGHLVEWYMRAPLNAAGEPFGVFSDHEYTIKGIYKSAIYSTHDAAIALGANAVIIPAASVVESDENNIADYGRMLETTTSFQIPNGTIEAYMEKWLAQGIDDLEITFYDRGYTQLHRGLENMRRASALFLAVGGAMALVLAVFFSYVTISKNKTRSAYERALGYTKKQCAVSLLSGFLLAAAVAIAVGGAAGVYMEGRITSGLLYQELYDTSYTIGPLGRGDVTIDEFDAPAAYAPLAGLALLIATAAISSAFMYANLKDEPLIMLSGKQE